MDANFYTTACCDPSLFNHKTVGFPFSSATDVETWLGLNSGEVTAFDSGEFNTLIPYDLDINTQILATSEYYDYWGVCRNILQPSAAVVGNFTFFSNSVTNIENKAFGQASQSIIHIKSVLKLGVGVVSSVKDGDPFLGCADCEITIDNCHIMNSANFTNINDSIIKLGSNIKAVTWVGSTVTPLMFTGVNNILYCSQEFANDTYVASCIAAAGSNLNVIIY